MSALHACGAESVYLKYRIEISFVKQFYGNASQPGKAAVIPDHDFGKDVY